MGMRLIDADALLAAYDREHVGPPGRARKLIEEAPDAVVKCKDCKHGRQYDSNAIDCEYRELATEPDWFCADGERKSE